MTRVFNIGIGGHGIQGAGPILGVPTIFLIFFLVGGVGGYPPPLPLRDLPKHPRDLFGGDYIKRESDSWDSFVPIIVFARCCLVVVLWDFFQNGGPKNARGGWWVAGSGQPY